MNFAALVELALNLISPCFPDKFELFTSSVCVFNRLVLSHSEACRRGFSVLYLLISEMPSLPYHLS